MSDPVRVLYIAGSGRSGSTLLDNILGQVDGFFSAGELRFIWERSLRDNRLCGCGKPFSDCEVWAAVFEEAFGGFHAIDAERVRGLLAHGTRMRHVPLMLASRGERDRLASRTTELREILDKLYRAIRTVTGARVIIDSSKLPAYGFVLSKMSGIDLKVVHLVRDPRATAYSWQRRKELTDGATSRYMERQGALKATVLWDVWNGITSVFWPPEKPNALRIRYEAFIADPQPVVRSIVEMCGEGGARLPFIDERTAELRPNHTVAGNPDRLRHGAVVLRNDDEWKTRMVPRQRRLVGLVAAPTLKRYGYRR